MRRPFDRPRAFSLPLFVALAVAGMGVTCINGRLEPIRDWVQVPAMGPAQGAGLAATNFDGDPRPDLVLMAYSTGNRFSYSVGWNLDDRGVPTAWDHDLVTSPSYGLAAADAGLAVAHLDDNPGPELVFLIYEDGAADRFSYRIAWNIGTDGKPDRWGTEWFSTSGVGGAVAGAGVEIASLDGNPRPDLIVMAQHQPSRQYRYHIGWNLDETGRADRWTNNTRNIDAPVGVTTTSALVVGDLISAGFTVNPEPDLLLLSYYTPNEVFAGIAAADLNTDGRSNDISPRPNLAPAFDFTPISIGAAAANVNVDPRPELFVMAHSGASSVPSFVFAYRVLLDFFVAPPP